MFNCLINRIVDIEVPVLHLIPSEKLSSIKYKMKVFLAFYKD